MVTIKVNHTGDICCDGDADKDDDCTMMTVVMMTITLMTRMGLISLMLSIYHFKLLRSCICCAQLNMIFVGNWS